MAMLLKWLYRHYVTDAQAPWIYMSGDIKYHSWIWRDLEEVIIMILPEVNDNCGIET